MLDGWMFRQCRVAVVVQVLSGRRPLPVNVCRALLLINGALPAVRFFSWQAPGIAADYNPYLNMHQIQNVSRLGPGELRLLIRQNHPKIRTTTGLAHGKMAL